MTLIPATNLIHDNEPCFGLAEVNRVTKTPGEGPRRFQVVQVVRNDEIVTCETDMGEASGFMTEEFAFPGHVVLGNGHYDVVETVGRLKGAADDYRAKYDEPTPRNAGHDDLVASFEEFATRRRDARTGRTHFAT